MSGKEQLDQEIPLPPEIVEWANFSEMQYESQASDDQQELKSVQLSCDKEIDEDKSEPIENQIVGYSEAQDQYAIRTAGEIKYVDSSELFQKVSDGEKVFVEGVEGSIPGTRLRIKKTRICLSRKAWICFLNISQSRISRRNLTTYTEQLNLQVSTTQFMTTSRK